MKRSIKHLPKRTQEELNTLLELIIHYIPRCSMVILYGSYARGGYVLWDQKVEFGINTSYQSDYDIMVVVAKSNIKHVEGKLRDKVKPRYRSAFAHRRHALPQFVVEFADTLNKELESGQYFFTGIVNDGIKIYDTKEFKLAKPRELSFREIKEFAESEFKTCFTYGSQFINQTKFALSEETYVIGSFLAHQAAERFYYAISLAFTNYRPKNHKLDELGAQMKESVNELTNIFPLNTDFQKRCFDLLCRAYIEARYNKDFVVTKEELLYMLERTEVLKEITFRICTEKIASYDALIGEGEVVE